MSEEQSHKAKNSRLLAGYVSSRAPLRFHCHRTAAAHGLREFVVTTRQRGFEWSSAMPCMPKCLLVDDSESMLHLLCMFMENLGFEPLVAHDGDEGIAVVRNQHPDLVVSDIHMPNRNGLLLLQDIRQLNPDLPVILITGYMSYKSDLNSISVEPDAFMEKPFTLEQLKETVSRLQPAIEHAWAVH
jgi:CheY-like chemotaxis protein